MNKFEIGQKVYFIESWTDKITAAHIAEFGTTEKGVPYAEVKCCDGDVGSCSQILKNLFVSKEDAQAFKKKKHDDILKDYRDQINSVQDLVRFMFTHEMSNGHEYEDWDARNVAIEKAKEYGIDLAN